MLTSIIGLTTISITNIPKISNNNSLVTKINNENSYKIFYSHGQDVTGYNLVWVDTVEFELPNILNLFKKLNQIPKEKNKKLQILNASSYFLTDNLKPMTPEPTSRDFLIKLESLINTNNIKFESVKLRIAVRNQILFNVSLKYKISDKEENLELFNFVSDDLCSLLVQKFFTTTYRVTYEI